MLNAAVTLQVWAVQPVQQQASKGPNSLPSTMVLSRNFPAHINLTSATDAGRSAASGPSAEGVAATRTARRQEQATPTERVRPARI
jgi:hypothetical protein